MRVDDEVVGTIRLFAAAALMAAVAFPQGKLADRSGRRGGRGTVRDARAVRMRALLMLLPIALMAAGSHAGPLLNHSGGREPGGALGRRPTQDRLCDWPLDLPVFGQVGSVARRN